eukprot:403341183
MSNCKVSQNSQDFPLFSSNRSNQPSPRLPGGKFAMPDCTSGVSKEFPTYFKNQHQLKSRISLDNPYIEEDFRAKSIIQARKQSLNQDPLNPSNTLRNSQNNSTINFAATQQLQNTQQNYNTGSFLGKFDKDFRKENVLKNIDRMLLRNLDKQAISNMDQVQSLHANGSQTQRALPGVGLDLKSAKNKDAQDKIQISVDLKQSFNDFQLEENQKADKQNFLKLPQIPIRQYDCIRDKEVVIQPPDLEIESYSKFRDKYYSIMNNQPKPFNKKLGLFTLFSDKTVGEKIMNKIYDQISKEGGDFKEFKKVQAQHNIQILQLETQRQHDESMTSINTSMMKGSNSSKVLALPKNRFKYRYYNNGEFIEKKDDSLHRQSLDQLQLSKQLQKKGVFGVVNPNLQTQSLKFDDMESLTSYQDNLMPQVDKRTMIKTKSLSSLFKRGSLVSLHSTLKPSHVPAFNDDNKERMKEHFRYLDKNEKSLESLRGEIDEFEGRNLRYETQKFEKSPPLYSPARLQRIKLKLRMRNMEQTCHLICKKQT